MKTAKLLFLVPSLFFTTTAMAQSAGPVDRTGMAAGDLSTWHVTPTGGSPTSLSVLGADAVNALPSAGGTITGTLGVNGNISSNSSIYANSEVVGNQGIWAYGSAVPSDRAAGSGSLWNITGGQGESDFVNIFQAGSGGFNFYSSGSPTQFNAGTRSLLFSVGSTGNITSAGSVSSTGLSVTGNGSLSGNLTVNGLAVDSQLWATAAATIGLDTAAVPLKIYGPNGSTRTLNFYGYNSSTSTHYTNWTVGENSTALTGSNVGGDFQFSRYSDTGTGIDSPVTIFRSTGQLHAKTGDMTNLTSWTGIFNQGMYGALAKASATLSSDGSLVAGRVNPTIIAPVSLGGITGVGLENMATASNFTNSIAGGLGFYAHGNFLAQQVPTTTTTDASGVVTYVGTPSSTITSIVSNFSGSTPIAELGYSVAEAARQVLQGQYNAAGIYPRVALVNVSALLNTNQSANNPVFLASNLTAWKTYVDAVRSLGVPVVAPYFSPNSHSSSTGWEPYNWNDPSYTTIKQMALYGGGLAMDTPVNLYVVAGSGYVQFAQQQLAWCHANGVACFDTSSPYNTGSHTASTFTADTIAWLTALTSGGYYPAGYVVENYTGSTDANGNNNPVVSSETTANSLSAAALAVLQQFGTKVDTTYQNHLWNGTSMDRARIGSLDAVNPVVLESGVTWDPAAAFASKWNPSTTRLEDSYNGNLIRAIDTSGNMLFFGNMSLVAGNKLNLDQSGTFWASESNSQIVFGTGTTPLVTIDGSGNIVAKGTFTPNSGSAGSSPGTASGGLATVSGQSNSSSYTFQSSDCNTVIRDTGSSNHTDYVPASLPVGCRISVLQAGSGYITVAPASGSNVTPEYPGGSNAATTGSQFSTVKLFMDTSSTVVIGAVVP